MTRICLVRHPPVDLPAGVCYGASDVPAVELSGAKLRTLSARLPRDARIVSSPLSRCRRLAESLAGNADRVRLDTRLREINFGDWELQPFDRIDRGLIDAWAAQPWDFVPPGGESAQAMSERALSALHDALQDAPDSLVVVAHGGPLRVILGTLLRLPREEWLGLPCEPGSMTCLQPSGSVFEIERAA